MWHTNPSPHRVPLSPGLPPRVQQLDRRAVNHCVVQIEAPAGPWVHEGPMPLRFPWGNGGKMVVDRTSLGYLACLSNHDGFCEWRSMRIGGLNDETTTDESNHAVIVKWWLVTTQSSRQRMTANNSSTWTNSHNQQHVNWFGMVWLSRVDDSCIRVSSWAWPFIQRPTLAKPTCCNHPTGANSAESWWFVPFDPWDLGRSGWEWLPADENGG